MLIVVIDDPYDRFRFNHQAYEMPVGGGIHRISSQGRSARSRKPRLPGAWPASLDTAQGAAGKG
ncbi:hypothetical protein, partial [Methylobacterium symbioticum]|uniref:hypothetical protein n=1 Tax=Methylobacterium symbioticum TaxID=2584084 RepID=UPI001AEEA87D